MKRLKKIFSKLLSSSVIKTKMVKMSLMYLQFSKIKTNYIQSQSKIWNYCAIDCTLTKTNSTWLGMHSWPQTKSSKTGSQGSKKAELIVHCTNHNMKTNILMIIQVQVLISPIQIKPRIIIIIIKMIVIMTKIILKTIRIQKIKI